MRDLQSRVQRVLDRLPDQVAADDHDSDADPGRHDRPPVARADGSARERVLDDRAPRDGGGVGEAEERERGLVEDGDRDRQDHVRDQERRDLRQDVAQDDPNVTLSEGSSALDVYALAHALHLRPDHACRRGPEQDPDHDDDVEEARPPDRRHDDHQRHVGDDEEVVGDAHQDRVGRAPEVAGNHAHRAADRHRDERRGEPDDERDARAPHEQGHHVDAAVVEAERMAPRRMPEHGPDLLVQGVRRDPRREHRAEPDEHEDRRPDHCRRPVAQRVQHEPAPARDSLRRRLDHEGRFAHVVILGSSLK